MLSIIQTGETFWLNTSPSFITMTAHYQVMLANVSCWVHLLLITLESCVLCFCLKYAKYTWVKLFEYCFCCCKIASTLCLQNVSSGIRAVFDRLLGPLQVQKKWQNQGRVLTSIQTPKSPKSLRRIYNLREDRWTLWSIEVPVQWIWWRVLSVVPF